MANKQRELPSWMERMGKEGNCFTRKVTTKTKKKFTPRVTVYFMNEWELVQNALVFGDLEDKICHVEGLTEKVLKPEGGLVKKRRQEAGMDSNEQGTLEARTSALESDLDTAELETLPYGNTNQGHNSGNEECTTSTLTDHQPDTVSDDEALKLVREIFFT